MANIKLYPYQLEAVKKMKNGCILNGGVGSGKSRTALSYYYISNGGEIENKNKKMIHNPKDLYIITTARKRDDHEWEKELIPFLITTNEEDRLYNHKVVIDSWNNIKRYIDVKDSFFIFDEQRVVGRGTWAKSFIKITRSNDWIMLSATPGDKWEDYTAVFIANGFFRNFTQFEYEHVVYSKFQKHKIDRYLNTGRLIRLRNKILIDMDFDRKTVAHHETIYADYDKLKYRNVMRDRWDIYKNEPVRQASSLCYVLRRVVNEDESRQIKLLELLDKHSKIIVFYNFDYELDILKNIDYGDGVEVAQYNGHKHQPIPTSEKWVYLVQYTAGAEGWNCILTDTIVFYSQNYSYKILKQSCGRIDRLNTPYINLYYYHFKSTSSIDLAISRALRNKKKFNETRWFSKEARI